MLIIKSNRPQLFRMETKAQADVSMKLLILWRSDPNVSLVGAGGAS